jgi:hypothetical protein
VWISRVPYLLAPNRMAFDLKSISKAGLKPPAQVWRAGVFFDEGHAAPDWCNPTLLKFKETCPLGQYRDLASRPTCHAHETATNHTKGSGHDLVRPLHRERHDSPTNVTARWPTDADPRSARLSRPAGTRNPSSPTGAKT